jgi:hypothetical protein
MVSGTVTINLVANADELAHGTTNPLPGHPIAKRESALKAILGLKYTFRPDFGVQPDAAKEKQRSVS